jgi:flagellar hook-associated protein FlgK
MSTVDDDTLNKLVELLAGKLSDRLLEQQKEQMNKMQDEMNKLKEAVIKKVEDVASGGNGDGEHEAIKTPKGFARVSYEYSSYSKSNTHLPTINPGKPPQFDGV